MAVTLVDWLNDGTLPQSKSSGNWTPSDFNTGKFRQVWTPTNASTHSSWRPGSLTFWAILTTNDANGGGIWLQWDPGSSTHTLMVSASSSGSPIATLDITWDADDDITYVVDQSVAGTNNASLTVSGAASGNGTDTYTREDILTGANLHLGIWGSGGFDLNASTFGDIDDGNDGITGTAAITLGAAVVSGAGQLAIQGQTSATLDAATSSAAGALAIQGQASVTLGDATVSAAGVGEGIEGSASVTLDDAAVAGSGDLAISGAGSITLDDATVSASGSHDGGITGDAAITLDDAAVSGAGTLPITGTAAPTLAAATVSASGTLPITGSAAVTLADAVLAASSSELALGDFGAARVLFGTPAGTCTVTLDTAASTSIVVVTGGNLGDLADAPTDSNGNTYTAVGSAEEFADWPGYGLRAWVCLDATGGASHAISQEFGQTLGFDEVTICAWEVKGATLVQASAIVERADAGTVDCGSVSTNAAAVIIQAWCGDAPTGETAEVSISDGTVIDVTTLEDHPNGYVPIAMAYAAKSAPVSSYAPSWTASPTQGAILVTVALQAVEGRVATGSVTLDDATVSATGEGAHAGQGSITLDDATVSGAGVLPITGAASPTLDDATVAGDGDVALQGAAAVTLDDATPSAQGALAIEGTAAIALDDATPAATGTLPIVGVGAATLDDATAAGQGVIGSFAIADVTLDDATASATGELAITGSASPTLDDASVDGAGTLPITGSGAVQLADATVSAAGAENVTQLPPGVIAVVRDPAYVVRVNNRPYFVRVNR